MNGGDELTTTQKTVTYNSEYNLTIPTRTGYTFAGWYLSSTQITDEKGAGLAVWSYAENKTLKAKWTANNYTVTLKQNNSSAGTATGGGEYAYDSSVTVKATTNSGYTWVGWYDGETELTKELSYTFTMGLGSTYTAKWSKVTLVSSISDAGTVGGLTST